MDQQYNSQYGVADQNQTTSVGSFLGMLLIGLIPIVGIIMWFVWAFGGNVNPNKKNFARAYLLYILIMTVVGIIISVTFGAALFAALAGAGSLGY